MARRIATLAAAIGILASGLSLSAHHSFAAQFDRDKPITIKGSVTRIEWANPHVYFRLDVTDDKGVTENWAVEAQAPSVLYRAGFRKDSARYGDVVTVDGYLAKDGSKLVSMQRATLADGRSLFVGVQLPPRGR